MVYQVAILYVEPIKIIKIMKQLLEKENVKHGRVYISKFALIYSFKKNGERYAKPTEYLAFGNEKSQDDVLVRLQKNNPTQKFEIA